MKRPGRQNLPSLRRSLALGRVWIGLAAVVPAGCGGSEKVSPAQRPLERAVTRTARSGNVELRFTVAPGDLPFTDKATIIITAEADAGTTMMMEDYDAILGHGEHQFELTARLLERKDDVSLPDGRLAWRARYELGFVLPGEYRLAGPTLTYVEGGGADEIDKPTSQEDGRAEGKVLSAESITVIAEATDEAMLSPEELTRIEMLPPVELQEGIAPWSWLVPLLIAAVTVVAVLLQRRARRRKAGAIVLVPAHEWAQAALARLVAEDLLQRGLVQEFHYRISDILRGYIERRYGIFAREMTTEEFLETAADDPQFDARARGDLDRFLSACDPVKYARHHATPAEGRALLETTQALVERTRERHVRIRGEGDDTVRGGRAA